MSEYQYYEFQAIDRPLTEEEQQAVSQLSSRVDPHPWRAVFVYHWGDFRGNNVQQPNPMMTQWRYSSSCGIWRLIVGSKLLFSSGWMVCMTNIAGVRV
jgi:hypothetical protein